MTRLKELSAKWRWVQRAEGWDRHLASRRDAASVSQAEVWARLRQNAQARSLQLADKLRRWVDEALAAPDLERPGWLDLARLIRAVVLLESTALAGAMDDGDRAKPGAERPVPLWVRWGLQTKTSA
jgi:hypothetical protein